MPAKLPRRASNRFPGGTAKSFKHDRIVQLDQFPTRYLGERLWKALGNLPLSKNGFREPSLEASDHTL
jgi:hypothetical protein